MLNKNDEIVALRNKEETKDLADFFRQFALAFTDTYMIVLLALDQICGRNPIIKRHKLVKELHK